MLASHLGLPLQYLQAHTTATEFIMWAEYLQEHLRKEEEWKFKIECYLAKLTAETRRSWVAEPKAVNDKDFLIVSKEEKEKEVVDEKKVEKSKQFWLSGLGLLKRKKK